MSVMLHDWCDLLITFYSEKVSVLACSKIYLLSRRRYVYMLVQCVFVSFRCFTLQETYRHRAEYIGIGYLRNANVTVT